MRKRWALLLVCLCVGLASGCAYAQVSADSATAQGAAPVLSSTTVFGTVVGGGGELVSGPTFRVNGVYSLQVKVVWQQIAEGLHVMQLKYTTPEGTVYETKATPFMVRNRPVGLTMSQGDTPEAAVVTMKDVEHPVEAQAARPAPGTGYEVWSELLMGGTWAQRLPGNWKLDVMLDGSPTVQGTANFNLQAGT